MRERNDILLDDNWDLQVENGDFVTGEDLSQRTGLLLATTEGEWRQSPTVGVGTAMYLHSNSEMEFRRKIKKQFKDDGLQLTEFKKVGTELNINTEYA